jgi:hypothetical protein
MKKYCKQLIRNRDNSIINDKVTIMGPPSQPNKNIAIELLILPGNLRDPQNLGKMTILGNPLAQKFTL